MPAPIIMTHGAFCGGWVFENFRKPFEAAGHTVLAPDLRGHGPNDGSEAVVGVSMTDYARDIAELCAAQTQPAILMGHSLEQFPSVVTRGGIPKASRVRFTVRAGEEAGGYGQTSFG